MKKRFDLVLAHTSFLGHTGYAHHSREFFTTLNKYIPVRVRNFAHVKDVKYLTEEQNNMLIYQEWSEEPYKVGTPFDKNLFNSIVNVVLNETNHYFYYDPYEGPKVAYNVWESTRQPNHFFIKLLEYDQLWVPTNWQRDCSIEQGFPPDRVKVVPEGLDINKFCPGESPLPPGYMEDRFRFLLIGRWDRRKSTTEIIKAFLEEFGEDEPVDLFIHVDNPWGIQMDGFKTTEERLAYYGFIDKRIKILRDLERVENDDLYIAYLRHAHCFVSCARSEGWNIPLINAIAVGTPTICSDYGAQLEFADGISHKVNIKGHVPADSLFMQENVPGTVAEPDFEHLKYVMRQCYENYQEYKEKAFIGSIIVREKFTWENVAQKALTYLDELYESKSKVIRINLGCGDSKLANYINIDKYTTADAKMDITKLEYENDSVDEIYSSHTLEHVAKNDVLKVLNECYRVLKVNGVLELEVPDFESCVRDWLNASEQDRWGFLHDRIFGLQTHEGEFHKTGFTKSRLRYLLEEVGFEVGDVKEVWSHNQNCLKVRAIKKLAPVEEITFKYHFCDGAYLEVLGTGRSEYKVMFIDQDTNKIIYETQFTPNHWAKPNLKYFVNWLIKVIKVNTGEVIFEHKINLKDQRVFIIIDSKAMGDTLAWFPYVEEFRKKHECKVIVSTFWNDLFKDNYPEIEFVEPGSTVQNLYALYKIGAYDNDYERNKINWRSVPLQKVAADILGLEYTEIRPVISDKINKREIDGKYVVISQHSTFQAKFWMYPKGWQMIVDYLNSIGYKVVVVSTQPPLDVINIIDKTGPNRTIFDTINVIKRADLFIGISSGPSWIAWALNVPTILISGYSTEWAEMQDCIRILDKTKCNGCFNDMTLPLDRGNWNWCPRNKDFECTKSIHPYWVIDSIKKILNI